MIPRPALSRRVLLGAAGAAALLAAGCAVRVRTAPDGGPPDDARTAAAAGRVIERDGIAQVEFDWRDAARGRAVPVRLYLPAERAGTPCPLVLFSHGLGGSRRGYSYLGRHFARNGVCALHVQHVGSDRSLWRGSAFDLVARLQDAAQEREAVERVADLRYALDRLLAHPLPARGAGGPPAARIDPRRIVVAGHSYGANTALLAGGARIERAGRAVDLSDPRIACALLLSAPPFYGEDSLAAILRPVTLPTLHVTATGDDIRVPGFYSPAQDRIAVFEATGSPYKALAVFDGGAHSIFTDRATPGGPVLNARVKAATQELASAFLASVFDAEHDALRRWPVRHREILARFEQPPGLA